MAVKFVKFRHNHRFTVPDSDDFSNIKLVSNIVPNSQYKVLYVLDYVPRADLRDLNGTLLSNGALETFENILKFCSVPKHSFLVCAFHAARTVGKSDAFVKAAMDSFEERLFDIIQSYKPDKVVVFGAKPFQVLCPKECAATNGNLHNIIGVPFNKTLTTSDGSKLKMSITQSLKLDGVLYGESSPLEMIGYLVENIRNAHNNDLIYKVDRPKLKYIVIDTVSKFKKFFRVLCGNDLVAIDTETDNLYKIKNRVLLIQFAFDTETAFIIPLCHKDTPFKADELKYIFDKLRYYFEEVQIADGMIYANAQFDLAVMKTQFGIRHYVSPVIDIFASEMCLQEGYKFLQTVNGGYYYSLGNLACQYGDFSYQTANFSKGDRHNIANVPLDEDLLIYSGLDVVIPMAIVIQQRRKAEDRGYKKFISMSTQQMSDVVHSLSVMEYNGYPVDINYLFRLKMPDSPIIKEIENIKGSFFDSPAVKKVNRELLKAMGLKSVGLFGEEATAFQINVTKHKEKLFFDELGLKPINKGKTGNGKIDKAFQAKYSNIPEVKLFTSYSKAIKLRDAYVNQISKFWAEDEDFKETRRIRCRFNYLPVITGRVSASKPGLQQIPARSELGKHIKRLFTAPKGTFFVKCDYRAHEVRGWGIISQDGEVAKAFKTGQDLIKRYKLNPSKDLLKRIGLEGDVHKVNSAYFFAKKIEDVSKDDRDSIKGIIFGLIYGKLVSSLARDLEKELAYMENLVSKFMKRFDLGGKWFINTEKHAAKHLYVESPLGRRRNLFGYLFSKIDPREYSRLAAYFDRRAKNSTIQGMGSDFMMIGIRQFCNNVWKHYKKHDYYPHMKPCVSVHDSLEIETDYEHILLTINYLEKSLTTDVKQVVKDRHNFTLNSDLEIDFDLGVSTEKMSTWYGDLDELELIVYKGLLRQSTEFKYNYTDKEIAQHMNSCFTHTEYMPDWMISQATNHKPRFLNYQFDKILVESKLE